MESFLNTVYKSKGIIEAIFFVLALYTITTFGTYIGLDPGDGFGIPESATYLLHFFIITLILNKIFAKFIKKNTDKRKFFLYSLLCIVITVLIVMFIQMSEVLARRNDTRAELQKKNIVLTQKVCYEGAGGAVVYLDIACRQFLERNEYNKDGCYSRLLPQSPFSRKCTECLIICE